MLASKGMTRGTGSFKFKNMWLKAEGFVGLNQRLDSYQFFSTLCYVLANKLKQLKLDLKRWNKEVFKNVEESKKSLLEEIQALDGLEDEQVRRVKAKTYLENVPLCKKLARGRILGRLG
jgi:hypothetical protein